VRRHRVARTLVYTHRWLGIGLGVVFVLWFASGIVMIYARMPVLDPAERLAALSPIDFAAVRVSPAAVGGGASQFSLTTFAGRPVYRMVTDGVRQTVFADTGEVLAPLTREEAILAAIPFVDGATIRYDARLEDADQWTFSVRGRMPLHRLTVEDAEGTRLYVAENGGEVVMKTTASGRRWGYLGAVIHWIYFTPLRRQSALWSNAVIGLAVAGLVIAMAGLLRRPRVTGLVFGLTTLTWIFSGLLSMDPWDWSPGTTPTPAQRDAVSNGPLNPAAVALPALQKALAAFGVATPREIELVRFRGHHYLRAAAGLVAVDEAAQGPDEMFDVDDVLAAAHDAMPGVAIEGVYWMSDYDPYYYSRTGQLSLPVLRVRFSDPLRTWLYLDPRLGAIVRKEERLSRLNRWLYHGLHSLDFPFLYYRRPLWDMVVIVLSLGGIVLSVTTLRATCRRVRRGARDWSA